LQVETQIFWPLTVNSSEKG